MSAIANTDVPTAANKNERVRVVTFVEQWPKEEPTLSVVFVLEGMKHWNSLKFCHAIIYIA